MKKTLIILIPLLFSCAFGFRSPSSGELSQNTDSQNQNNQNSNSGGNDKLLQEMNKKTSDGLKVFDSVLKGGDVSKDDFFADVGQDPTADQFEGGDGSGGLVKNPFEGITGTKGN